MGTQFTIILYAKEGELAQNAANQAIKRINQLDQIFSDYKKDSEITRLSNSAGSGKKIKVSKEIWQLLKLSKKISKKSKGAFDVTIGPLSKLWRSMFRKKEIFNGVKINNKKSLVNYKNIRLYSFSKKVKLKQRGMRLDAGGIAKGFTVDEIVKVLNHLGFYQILVDGGGDIFAGTPPPQKAGWTIQLTIQHKINREEKINLVLANTAIASSGDTYHYLEQEGKRYSHLIDPRTGYGITNSRIVNVLAPSCALADALASTISILSDREAKYFLKKFKNCLVY